MALLSGPKIVEEIEKGRIKISPFNPDNVNPNSVNLSLGSTLLVYQQPPWWQKLWMSLRGEPWCLDMARNNQTEELWIPPTGRILWPGVLYLGSTIEIAGSSFYVPCIEGRSSPARLGLTSHQSAGFGDVGFQRTWVLEITVVHPLRVYANRPIVQVNFSTVEGELKQYDGKYKDQKGPVASKLYEEFSPATGQE